MSSSIPKNGFCFGLKSRLFAFFFDLIQKTSPSSETKPPQRILLCNWGHLGDVLLATSVIANVKHQFPNAKIGFLVSPESRCVLETCEGIDWVHEVPNWSLGPKSVFKKLWHFFKQDPSIIEELREKNYDCAYELYPFFPNAIPLLYKAKIPIRIGFNTSGNSRLLTHSFPWPSKGYLPLNYGAFFDSSEPFKFKPPETTLELPEAFILFHVCSANEKKELPADFWLELKKKFHLPIYFTGKGERARAFISHLEEDPQFNFCNRLSWQEFIWVIHKANLLISVDSVPVHLAAALDTPFVVLYKATPHQEVWFPATDKGLAFDYPVETETISQAVLHLISDSLGVV